MSIITMGGGGRGGLRGAKGVISAEANPDYPNMPAGMEDAAWFKGDSQDSSVNSGDWGGWSASADITIVADATSPGPTGSVIEFNYDVGDTSAGIRTANTWAGGPYNELYIMYRVKMVSPWESTADSKLFYWGAVSGSRNNTSSPTQYFVTYQDGPSTMFVSSQNSAPSTRNMLNLTGFWTGEVGNWVEFEMHCVSESSPGAADGSLYVWKNGTLEGSDVGTEQYVNGADPAVGFDGMQWYNTSGHVAGVSRQLRVAELRVMGK